MATQSKEDIYLAVCNSILQMEVVKGHLKWTMSDISRESGVTRSLIYYYFGKEKDVVLAEAYKFIISNFFDTDRSKTMDIRERLAKVLKDLESLPYMVSLYYLEKKKNSEFGKLIREFEVRLLANMRSEFPHLSEDQVLEVYLKELGAIMYQLPSVQVDRLFGQDLKR